MGLQVHAFRAWPSLCLGVLVVNSGKTETVPRRASAGDTSATRPRGRMGTVPQRVGRSCSEGLSPKPRDKTPGAVWRTTGLVVSQMTRGTTAYVACRVTCGIARRATRPVTEAATCPAADRIPWETTDEGLRAVTSQTAPRTMYEATMHEARRIASEIALPTMYEATLSVTTSATRGVIPRVGLSASSLKPNAASHKQISRKDVSDE